jgi:hypothetical protein
MVIFGHEPVPLLELAQPALPRFGWQFWRAAPTSSDKAHRQQPPSDEFTGSQTQLAPRLTRRQFGKFSLAACLSALGLSGCGGPDPNNPAWQEVVQNGSATQQALREGIASGLTGAAKGIREIAQAIRDSDADWPVKLFELLQQIPDLLKKLLEDNPVVPIGGIAEEVKMDPLVTQAIIDTYRDPIIGGMGEQVGRAFVYRLIELSKIFAKDAGYVDKDGKVDYRIFAVQLANLINLETAGSFDPQVTNPYGFKGLIQFSPGNWAAFVAGKKDHLGRSCETDPVAQLDSVFAYLRSNRAIMPQVLWQEDASRGGLILLLSVFAGPASPGLFDIDNSTISDVNMPIYEYARRIRIKPEQLEILENN